MYSGTTFRRDSGRIIGAHQKIDRVARRRLDKHIPDTINFPRISSILHFEGKNGPDGLKLKSPTQDEYEHSINPANSNDTALITIINNHITNLTKALSINDEIRASFEAAWLAHAIVDGLTPAHHFPDNDSDKESWIVKNRKIFNLKNKKIVDELTKRQAFMQKWGTWGTGGMVAHVLFELGVSSVITPNKFKTSGPDGEDFVMLRRDGFEKIFIGSVHKVYDMKMYDDFCKKGWTRHLAVQTKNILVPEIIKIVTLAWYQAIINVPEQK